MTNQMRDQLVVVLSEKLSINFKMLKLIATKCHPAVKNQFRRFCSSADNFKECQRQIIAIVLAPSQKKEAARDHLKDNQKIVIRELISQRAKTLVFDAHQI